MVGGSLGVLAAQVGAELPEGEAKPIVARSCTACHGLEVITSIKLSKEKWRGVVLEMQARGADVTEKELPFVVDYLAQHFGEEQQSGGQQEHKSNSSLAGPVISKSGVIQ
jgi:hypothetical protein